MRRSRFSEDQIIGTLKEAEAGVPVLELCRKHGFSEHSYYRWKKKYGGMEVGDARRLRGVLPSPNRAFLVESTTGDIRVRAKARFSAGSGAVFRAPSGSITFDDGVRVRLRDGTQAIVIAEALGAIHLERAGFDIQSAGKLASRLEILGGSVSLAGKTKIEILGSAGPHRVDIRASAGDVVLGRPLFTSTAPITLSGHNVAIGVEENGNLSTSRITFKDQTGVGVLEVVASGQLDVRNLRLRTAAATSSSFEGSGTEVNVRESDLIGTGATTFEVSGGAGSTCDLTGTTVRKASLVVACESVEGP